MGGSSAIAKLMMFFRLWDFETLTLLYRIKSYDFEVKALAFSGDGLRLVDIRDSRSKIWEPAAIVRKTIEEDVSVSDAALMPAITVGLDYFNEILNVTALAAHPSLTVIFAGKSNGSVSVYDATTGKEKTVLYSHPKDVFVTAICCCKNDFLASADAGGAIQVWKIQKSNTGVWSTHTQITSISLRQSIRMLLPSPDGEYLLISAASIAVVLSTRTGVQVGSNEFSPGDRTVWKWLATPGPTSELLLIVDNNVEHRSWNEFPKLLDPPKLSLIYDESLRSDGIEIQNALLDSKSQHLIVDFRKHYGNKATTKLLVFDYPDSAIASNDLKLNSNFSSIGKKVKYFIGVASSRLVFIDTNSWLSSVDLLTLTGKLYTRHFYVPHEVVNGNTGVVAVLTAAGDIAFAREGELAIVRNGERFHDDMQVD